MLLGAGIAACCASSTGAVGSAKPFRDLRLKYNGLTCHGPMVTLEIVAGVRADHIAASIGLKNKFSKDQICRGIANQVVISKHMMRPVVLCCLSLALKQQPAHTPGAHSAQPGRPRPLAKAARKRRHASLGVPRLWNASCSGAVHVSGGSSPHRSGGTPAFLCKTASY